MHNAIFLPQVNYVLKYDISVKIWICASVSDRESIRKMGGTLETGSIQFKQGRLGK